MDVVVSEFLTKDGKYDLNFKKQPNDGAHVLKAESIGDLYREFVRYFRIVSIEDPFNQDHWSSWSSLNPHAIFNIKEKRSDPGQQEEDDRAKSKEKPLTGSIISSWCKLIIEKHNQSALISLLNAYRATCNFGAEIIGYKFQSNASFCNILMFMLSNADDIFQRLFQTSSFNCRKEAILEMKNFLGH
ncbi:Phosphopyruvate hydratase [Forsythia ovata]|uniref:phosphopyruvate hydratase n=1 Tax=Forsythia ovata TaxID=205694 RepID=A0ABD1U802_9LAMI